jgi:hypothetical protein
MAEHSLRHEINDQGQCHYQDQEDGCGNNYRLTQGITAANTAPVRVDDESPLLTHRQLGTSDFNPKLWMQKPHSWF